MKTAKIIITLAVAFSSAHAANLNSLDSDPTLEKIKATKTFNIAVRETSIPMSYLVAQADGSKQPMGLAVDLCNAVASTLRRSIPDLQVNYVVVTSSSRIPVIKEGKADAECGSTTNSASRRKEVSFSIPYYIASITGATKAEYGIKNLNDLADGSSVAYTKGTTTEDAVRKLAILFDNKANLGTINKVIGNDHQGSFNAMADGQAKVFLNDDILLYGLIAQSDKPSDFRLLNQVFTVEPYGIMSRKDSPVFGALVNSVIAEMMQNGQFVELYKKWLLSPIPPKNVSLKVPMSTALKDVVRFPTNVVGN